ncbi:hypothetical protein BDZ97DRAFT_1924229 [Flammula alnicola]|nr:hypothetical protein BDZ97DRAFT_1924229 [Flammula alnicola]
MTITEISWFQSSSAYRADHALVNDAVRRLKQADGIQRIYVAFEIEHPKTAYIVKIWTSYDHYLSAVKQPSYTAALESLKPALDGTLNEIETVFVAYTTTPEEALAAPVSEIVLTGLKDGETEKDLIALDEAVAASGVTLGNHWGPVHGKAGSTAFSLGGSLSSRMLKRRGRAC